MIRTQLHDDGAGGLVVVREDDCQQILDWNRAMYAMNDGYSRSRALRRAASIPPIVAELWLNRYGVNIYEPDHRKAVLRLLDSNEWLWLRTAPGRLS
jgi:hypothetical protein